ncbi:hypothetical protein [Halovivax limisalsi]|uniref:hypothetical protein n=1 Tax=Halovivax limisalsi TaxID=1453760 RepID=UPI001FFD1E3E|nr:hypothetical protein [Halovivax limisalsi]
MQTVLERFDSRRGIVGLLVVASLLAGFIVATNAVSGGESEALVYFIGFVVVMVAAFVGGTIGWNRVRDE